VTGDLIVRAAKEAGQANVLYLPDRKQVNDELEALLKPGDLLLTLGAGDVVRFGEEYLARGGRG
jgi:UDP-N-acetylmuramate--alanine ligase